MLSWHSQGPCVGSAGVAQSPRHLGRGLLQRAEEAEKGLGALGPVRVPAGAGSLGGTISSDTVGLAGFPDLGRTHPSHRWGPDASIVQTGKLRSVVAERSLWARFCCCTHAAAGAQSLCSVQAPGVTLSHSPCTTMSDVRLVLVNKNIPDVGAGELGPPRQTPRSPAPAFLCGPPASVPVSRPGSQGSLRKDSCVAGWARRGPCSPEVGRGPCSPACFQPDVAF